MLEKLKALVFGSADWGDSAPDNLREFDRLVGEVARDAAAWRAIAAVFALSSFVSVGVSIWAVRQPKTVPVLITMADWGEAKYVGRADKLNYHGLKIPDVAVQYQLRKFVMNTFAIPNDYEVLKANLNECYACLTGASSDAYSSFLKRDGGNPLRDFKDNVRRKAEVETVLRLSEDSWQVDFVVSRVNAQNELLDKKRMRSTCGVAFYEPPKESLIKNPLGIYITNFDFSEIGEAK